MLIVTGTDGSPAAEKVISRAIEQARLTGAQLHVVHVFQPPAMVYTIHMAYVPELETFAQAGRKAVWEEAARLLDDSGLEWVRVDLEGYPPSAITDYARQAKADLIVIGTRGLGGVASLVLGSTSRGVIHDAPCDVLVVDTKDAQD